MPIVIREDSMKEISALPNWKADDGELWWLGNCIKRFKNDARLQRALLDALEAADWCKRLADLVKAGTALPNKKSLQNAVKNMKRSLPKGSIRFAMDGTACGVRWFADG